MTNYTSQTQQRPSRLGKGPRTAEEIHNRFRAKKITRIVGQGGRIRNFVQAHNDLIHDHQALLVDYEKISEEFAVLKIQVNEMMEFISVIISGQGDNSVPLSQLENSTKRGQPGSPSRFQALTSPAQENDMTKSEARDTAKPSPDAVAFPTGITLSKERAIASLKGLTREKLDALVNAGRKRYDERWKIDSNAETEYQFSRK
ncbi:hypothetical protein [Aestuariivirga litoralis]|uniref:hypothetical protein n=1 Tax=Aestuariivirga litoralis TaxID=2650924 RepID=UPI0018C68FF0|nr:hypothetical protein [Aestuariivirga litoralis]MBG1233975.1 hypothetical protein [Aestuariivirga litoralis]